MSATIVEASKKNIALSWISYIYHFIWFKKDKIRALIDFGNKINAIMPVYALK